MSTSPHTFHEMLAQSRLEANQTIDAIAILLNMAPEEYEALERDKYPDDETLVKLCKLMGWNYYEAQRLIINEMISPHPRLAPRPAVMAPLPPIHRSVPPQAPLSESFKKDSLAVRLREVRESTGQSVEIIALLLKIDVEGYRRIEAGEAPSDDLLRRISVIYNWNYNELKDLLLAERARTYQPHLRTPPMASGTIALPHFRQLTSEMVGLFERLSAEDQKMVMAQMELIRDTMRRHQKVTPQPTTARA